MKHHYLISLLAITLITTSCSQDGGADGGVRKQDVGTLTGAIVGGIVGSNLGKGKGAIAGTIAGTMLGAYMGNQVGASLDRADAAYHSQTSQIALEKTRSGVTSTWHNPDSGHHGSVTPTRTFQTTGGTYCREYTQTITVGGETHQGVGQACRQPDGSWKIAE